MHKPFFGIVIPTHNRLGLLQRCLDSLHQQSCSDWIAVVIDDSTDGLTQSWMAEQSFENISYLKNDSNIGVGLSRNKGLDALCERVQYIVFLDDDDFFALDCLAQAQRFIDENTPVWCASRRIFHDSGESLTQVKKQKKSYNYLHDYLIKRNIMRDMTHFIQAKLLCDKRYRQDAIRSGGEWRFFCKLAEMHDFLFFEGGVTYTQRLEGGLTEQNTQNLEYKIQEKMDLLSYLAAQQVYPFKQLEFGLSIASKLRKAQDKALQQQWRHFKSTVKPRLHWLASFVVGLVAR